MLGSLILYLWTGLPIVAAISVDNPGLPSCAISCTISMFSNSRCDEMEDAECQCKMNAYESSMAPCVKDVCSTEDQEFILNMWIKTCEEFGVPVSINGTSLTSAPASDTTGFGIESTSKSTSPSEASTDSSLASADATNPQSKPSLSTATVAGLSVGVTLAVALLALGGFLFWRRRKRMSGPTVAQQADLLERSSDEEVVLVATTTKYAAESPPRYYELGGRTAQAHSELVDDHGMRVAHERGVRGVGS
ncbi:hypothetical protein M011DRAFT_488097 [Sporormia fimetaria CBS 119925]|uniref:CFEM domain-containing protein n=1 Tax=Sporormia fimetaria CBS 119925 TaxID=1340428 RepID=A0A6A6V848_9PLEO|nr:hypothetical protein M011DRAFT_488097 [Sporormia fimetaria CBS 119925]